MPAPASASTTTVNTSATSIAVPNNAKTPVSSTAANSEVDDFFADENEVEEEEGVISGVSAGRRIVLADKKYLLVGLISIAILNFSACVYTYFFYLEEYDYPPTENSKWSLLYDFIALIALTIITPMGFVILKFRITNILIGLFYLFSLVFCLIFPAQGIKYAYLSYTEDQDNTIHVYANNPNMENRLHNFWAAYQLQHQCCGTKEIDRVEDWSYFLNTTDLPATCCTQKQQDYAKSLDLNNMKTGNSKKPEMDLTINYCGKGLARTRTRGVGYRTVPFKRLYSGFYISLSQKQKQEMFFQFRAPGFQFEPNHTLVEILDVVKEAIVDVGAITAFMKIWKTFYVDNVCNSLLKLAAIDESYSEGLFNEKKFCTNKSRHFSNDIAYPGDTFLTTPIESIGVINNISEVSDACKNDFYKVGHRENTNKTEETEWTEEEISEYCEKRVRRTRENATTLGRELLLQLDYLTTYIYELGKKPDGISESVPKKTWMLWPIPTRLDPGERYPYKLNANFLRVDDIYGSNENVKQMFYFSRGIPENLLLEDVIHDTPCEFLEPQNLPKIRSKIARDLNKRWRQQKPFIDWKNKEEGLGTFFLGHIRLIAWITLFVSFYCILCVVIIAFVFWQYYSRIKAEEYANLALPKEFEVLHLRRGSLIDEADLATDNRKKKKNRAARMGKVVPAPPSQLPILQPLPSHPSMRQPMKFIPGQHPHVVHHHIPQIPGMGHGQSHTPGYGRGQFQTPGFSRGQPQTPGLSRGQPQAPGFSRGQPQAPGFSRGQTQTPGFSRGQPPTPGVNRGQPQAPGFSRGQPQAPGFSRGQPQAPGFSRGQPQTPGFGRAQPQIPVMGHGQPPPTPRP